MKMVASSCLHSFRLLFLLTCLSLAQPLAAVAQTNAPEPLPPAAQEAFDKGLLAAREQGYLVAIRYLQEARKLAPQAPVIYLNMGLAESKIPGRELRAIAWFSAYLAAYPDAPNAAAVANEIDRLELKTEITMSGLIKAVQDAAWQIPGTERMRVFSDVPDKVIGLWASIGNFTGALQSADNFQDPYYKNWVQRTVATQQAQAGDLAGARQTFVVALDTLDLIKDAKQKQSALHQFASEQAEAGDVAGAIKTADLVKHPANKYKPLADIAMAQAKMGDSVGARQTLSALRETADRAGDPWKDYFKADVIKVEAIIRAENAAKSNDQPTAIAQTAVPAITASDWLKKLDDGDKDNECPLNTGPFLDLAVYLKSLPPSDNPEKVFETLHETAKTIIRARNIIIGMLKQEIEK